MSLAAPVLAEETDTKLPMTPERLCSEYSAQVCRFAAMVARSSSDADDIAQEALLKAIRALDSFDPRRGSPETWLWRIVVNSARDMHRGERRRLAVFARLADLWSEPPQNVESLAIERISNGQLLEAVRSLPARDRTLIGLRFGADLDLETVGRTLGLTDAAAGRAVLRALARLRNRLEVHRAEA
jgi:RNA polymerase sigma factor (sigma-70 family)